MKSMWKLLSGLLALSLVVMAVVWTAPQGSISGAGTAARSAGGMATTGSSAARVAGGASARLGSSNNLPYTVTTSGPYTPTLSVAVRDLPDEPDLPTLDREPARRDDRGFVGPDIQMPPHGNLLAELQQKRPGADPRRLCDADPQLCRRPILFLTTGRHRRRGTQPLPPG